MAKYKVGNAGYRLDIPDNWRVLDVGSGHNPHPRANVLLDRYVRDNTERSGSPLVVNKLRLFVEGNVESLPFRDKEFDYIISSHIAEHVDNPEKFCLELMRVGKGGYIETPSKLAEIFFDEPYHKWYVYTKGKILFFEKIIKHARLGLFGKIFYAIFYVNTNRIGKKTLLFSNRYLRYISSTVIDQLIRKPWIKMRRVTYTCFEWKDPFEFKIIWQRKN